MAINKTLNRKIKDAATQILAADRILIASHINPDGDTIGCLLALGLGLLDLGKRVYMVSSDGVPPRFRFLPGSDLVLDTYKGKVDITIAVDCGSLRQLGPLAPIFQTARHSIQIDHHDFGEGFCKTMVVDHDAAAVGEIVYDLLKALKVTITPAIATGLLTSIIVDTGSFRFSNVRSRTLKISADLIDRGVDMKHLIEESYWKRSLSSIRLESLSVLNMKFECAGKVAWAVARQKDFKKENGQITDVDGVADALRSIHGVQVAALLRETPDGKYRVSMRSGHGINVGRAAQDFGGGGHHNSAGCTIRALKKDVTRLLKHLCSLTI